MQTVQRLYQYFKPNHYQLSLSLDQNNHTFHGVIAIEGHYNTEFGIVKLHSKELNIESVNINGKQAEYTLNAVDDEVIITPVEPQVANIIITIGFSGAITETMHGIYTSKYFHLGKEHELIATQFESHHAREAFPCVDEPEAKAIFDVTLTTKSGVTVLGNMPVKRQRVESNQLVTVFDTTPLMSSYLLAFVSGDLHKKSMKTDSGVEVNVWATLAQPAVSLDFALDHAVKTIEFFDRYFDTPYPLPKSDHVAIPDFTSGAMENWGLITYRETTLLADPATTTVSSKQSISTVISHELSHMWFGNLVTMKWWNDLWLNESFATLMEYVAVDAIHPEWNIWLDFAANESVMALRRDAMTGVQSVRVDVNHPGEISSLFDGAIVYAKGARLINMLRSYIGHEVFRDGIRSYFKSFAYQNTEAVDLWNELSRISEKDIASFMDPWLTKPGYPLITIGDQTVSQQRFFIGLHDDDSTSWPIPLEPSTGEPILLTESKLNIAIDKDTYLNHNNSAHFITSYDQERFDGLCSRIETQELPTIVRLLLLNEQLLLARSGVISSSRLVSLLTYYANEDNDIIWQSVARIISALKQFVEHDQSAETALKALSYRIVKTLYQSLGWHAKDDEPESDKKLRETVLALATYSDEPVVINAIDEIYHSSSIDMIDPEIRPLILSSVAKRSEGLEIIKSLFEQHNSTHSADFQSDIQAGLTSVRNRDQIDYVLSQLTDTATVRPQDLASWFVYIIRNRYARSSAWQWLKDSWPWIESQFSGDKSYDYFPRYAASGLVTKIQLDEYIEFFKPLRDEPSLTRTIDVGIVEIQARVDLLARDEQSVCKSLNDL